MKERRPRTRSNAGGAGRALRDELQALIGKEGAEGTQDPEGHDGGGESAQELTDEIVEEKVAMPRAVAEKRLRDARVPHSVWLDKDSMGTQGIKDARDVLLDKAKFSTVYIQVPSARDASQICAAAAKCLVVNNHRVRYHYMTLLTHMVIGYYKHGYIDGDNEATQTVRDLYATTLVIPGFLGEYWSIMPREDALTMADYIQRHLSESGRLICAGTSDTLQAAIRQANPPPGIVEALGSGHVTIVSKKKKKGER